MKIYESAVRKPVSTVLMFVGVMVFGLFSLMNLAVDQYPEIEIPQISVITFYPGANAADIETNITRILEDNLNTVSNLKKLTSKSQDNVSMIIVEFEYGSDLTEGANGEPQPVAVARRHRLSYDLQVLDLDDPRDHACRDGRRELPGPEEDPRR
jgi:multidrug efflux pump subunit AcrB